MVRRGGVSAGSKSAREKCVLEKGRVLKKEERKSRNQAKKGLSLKSLAIGLRGG